MSSSYQNALLKTMLMISVFRKHFYFEFIDLDIVKLDLQKETYASTMNLCGEIT